MEMQTMATRTPFVDVTRSRTSAMNAETEGHGIHTKKPEPLTFPSEPVSVRCHNPYGCNVMGDPNMEVRSPMEYFRRDSAFASQRASPVHRYPAPMPQAQTPVTQSPVMQAPMSPIMQSPVMPQPQSMGEPTPTTVRVKRVYKDGRPVVIPADDVVTPQPEPVAEPAATPASAPMHPAPRSTRGRKDVFTVQVQLRRIVGGTTHHIFVPSIFRSQTRFAPGTYVIVDGDRGHHVGIVAECVQGIENNHRGPRILSVRREATHEEVRRFTEDVPRVETQALEYAKQCAAEFKLDMDIVACEMQFDGQKLSLHYNCTEKSESPVFVPFVPLLKALHAKFRCRIWLNDLSPARQTKA